MHKFACNSSKKHGIPFSRTSISGRGKSLPRWWRCRYFATVCVQKRLLMLKSQFGAKAGAVASLYKKRIGWLTVMTLRPQQYDAVIGLQSGAVPQSWRALMTVVTSLLLADVINSYYSCFHSNKMRSIKQTWCQFRLYKTEDHLSHPCIRQRTHLSQSLELRAPKRCWKRPL